MARQDYIVGDSFRVIMQDGTMTIRHDGYDKALAAIQRVRELHVPEPCWCCEDVFCANCDETYPCSTKRELDGEQE